ncbi:MAG TPA: MBL fold metallo-hydrolase [Streptosporangiaceae bacterium]|nr:MBL fold metallo-hydrolase [Streptosporangiaceae bacterium]
MTSSPVDFASTAPVPVSLNVRWNYGSRSRSRSPDPRIQVHACDPHTFILRQSKAVRYEAPFLYLFCGNDRALLLDTGATREPDKFPLRETVDQILSGWLAVHPRDRYELVVAHTHGHGDHVAGDPQFAGRPDTTLVGRELSAVRKFFGFTDWPGQVTAFDLGGRVLEVTGSPGHHPAAITVYDPWSGFLVTGGTVYRGRLYAPDFSAFAASLERLADFASSRPVTQVLGCHIEMTTEPGRDYPLGATFQPDEPPLQLSVDQLIAVRDAARSVADQPGVHVFDDFIIYNGPCRLARARLAGRGALRKVWPRRRERPGHAA